MKLEHAPFAAGWWGTSLANVGLQDQRPDVGTYGRYDYAALPVLPIALRGDLAWLEQAPGHGSHIGQERAGEIGETLPKLVDACNRAGVTLPGLFLRFMRTPRLHAPMRSNTDCFLDLPPAPVPSPTGDGMLVRFLADSQGCLFWYLFFPTGVSDHAVVCSPDFYGPDAEDFYYGLDQEMGIGSRDPRALVFCAKSLEAFLCRFWIENELWFSAFDGTPMSEVCRQYLESYRDAPAIRRPE